MGFGVGWRELVGWFWGRLWLLVLVVWGVGDAMCCGIGVGLVMEASLSAGACGASEIYGQAVTSVVILGIGPEAPVNLQLLSYCCALE